MNGSQARKGLKRYGMRAYLVEGPRGAIVIRRLGARNWQVRQLRSDNLPWGQWGMRFDGLGDARKFSERQVGDDTE